MSLVYASINLRSKLNKHKNPVSIPGIYNKTLDSLNLVCSNSLRGQQFLRNRTNSMNHMSILHRCRRSTGTVLWGQVSIHRPLHYLQAQIINVHQRFQSIRISFYLCLFHQLLLSIHINELLYNFITVAKIVKSAFQFLLLLKPMSFITFFIKLMLGKLVMPFFYFFFFPFTAFMNNGCFSLILTQNEPILNKQ